MRQILFLLFFTHRALIQLIIPRQCQLWNTCFCARLCWTGQWNTSTEFVSYGPCFCPLQFMAQVRSKWAMKRKITEQRKNITGFHTEVNIKLFWSIIGIDCQQKMNRDRNVKIEFENLVSCANCILRTMNLFLKLIVQLIANRWAWELVP